MSWTMHAGLLHLWRTSTVLCSCRSRGAGKRCTCYGDNFGELLEQKIALMERHMDDEPHIDPGYMWRDE